MTVGRDATDLGSGAAPPATRPTFGRHETLPWAIREWADREPDRPFLHDVDGHSMSYGELHERALRWASVFATLGVSEGENVLVMARPALVVHEIWLGLGWRRGVQTGVNVDFRGNSLVYQVNDSGARVMVCAPEFAERVADVAGRLEQLAMVVVLDELAGTTADEVDDALAALRIPTASGARLAPVRAGELFGAADPAAAPAAPQRHEIACISYTSGTTGRSKGVLVPWGRLWPNEAWIDLTGDDVYYDPFPVFHMSGLLPLAWLGFPGGRVVVRDGFKTREFWSDVRRFGCTTTALIPVMMNWLLDQPERDDDLDNTLRFVSGAPVVPRVDEFKRRFGVCMRTVFGNTEIGTPLYAGPDVSHDRGSTGKWVTPGYEVRVVDEHDYEVPVGEVGELVVRTTEPWRMMVGYHGMPDATARAWRNGWFHTGDGVVQEPAGRYHFVDRITDSMRRRGENISSMEVEAYVNEHPAVAETAAIGVPSEHGEDEVKVCVVLRDGAAVGPAELHAFLAERMPAFMVPRYIELLVDPERTEAMHRLKKPPLRLDPLNGRTWDAATGAPCRSDRPRG